MPGKGFEQSRFACTVRSNEHHNFSTFYMQSDVTQKCVSVITNGQTFCAKICVRFHRLLPFLRLCRDIISAMTTGAPNTAVTELIFNSVGANNVRASKSQKRQNTAPPSIHAGRTANGFAVLSIPFTKCGTAIPTKDTGPAKAVTQAASRLERRISSTRKRFLH